MRTSVPFWMVAFCAVRLAVAQAGVNQDAPVLKDFEKRVDDYMKVRKIAQAEVHGLKPTAASEKIEHHRHQLAYRIREARAGAGQGSIFTPEIGAEFRRLIGLAMQGPDAARIRESVRRDAPAHLKPLRVNHVYPDGAPLPTTPPSLLSNLPPLPPELDYRVVGHMLILRDIEATLIVDLIPNAIP